MNNKPVLLTPHVASPVLHTWNGQERANCARAAKHCASFGLNIRCFSKVLKEITNAAACRHLAHLGQRAMSAASAPVK